jgi:hypothetical protein
MVRAQVLDDRHGQAANVDNGQPRSTPVEVGAHVPRSIPGVSASLCNSIALIPLTNGRDFLLINVEEFSSGPDVIVGEFRKLRHIGLA